MAAVALSTKAAGSIVYIKENGVNTPFIVLIHGYPASGRTLLLRQNIHSNQIWWSSSRSGNANYRNSDINTWLNNTYLNYIAADIKSQIASVSISVRYDNYNYSRSNMSAKVFLLSENELNIDDLYAEGSVISYFNSNARRAANASYITRSIIYQNEDHAVGVWTSGISVSMDVTESNGIRPAFTLPSTIYVDDSGNVTVNTAPVITSSSSGDLGTKSEDFSVTYTVTDAESDAVTVTEAVDGVQKRSYTATLGQQETFEISGDYFMRILNGQHTIKVTATDAKGMSSTLTLTFTKAVHSLSVTLTTPMTSEEAITKTVMSIVGSIPEDAELQVLLTNNANDDEPVWEDATATVKAGYNHVFTNATAANGYAFNFKLTAQRGPSGEGGYIETIGGAFE